MNKTKQILQQQIPDQKVAGHGKMFFSKVNVLCWLLFQYLFHPCVNVAAVKKSLSFCQKRRWQVTAKHTHTHSE